MGARRADDGLGPGRPDFGGVEGRKTAGGRGDPQQIAERALAPGVVRGSPAEGEENAGEGDEDDERREELEEGEPPPPAGGSPCHGSVAPRAGAG